MKKNSIELTLQLPEYIVKTIKAYDRSSDIDVNKFIADSIINHKEDVIDDSPLDDVACAYPENTLPLVVQIPNPLAFELGMEFSVRQHISISDAVSQMLPLSLANLISELQTQEDYMVEVALAKKLMDNNEHRGGDNVNSSNKIKSWLTDWADNDASVKPLLNNLEDNKHQNKADVWFENWVNEKS